MGKKKSIRRLIATGVMTAFTAASLITTSYAFVTLNTEASISEFKFDIEEQEGLLLSTDGNNFFQDIDQDIIRSAILNYKSYNVDELKKIKLKGVTLGGRNNATDPYTTGIFTEEYQYQIGTVAPQITDKRVTFVKDKVEWVEKGSTAANAITNTTLVNLLKENDRIGVHSYEKASLDDYIFFDLWLRVVQNGTFTNASGDAYHPTYQLRFSDRTTIEGNDQEVLLYNSLNTKNSTYTSGQKITVNTADAIRLGVNILGDSATNTDTNPSNPTYTLANSLKVYEPNVGLGSAAIEGATDDDHNPSKNAMYTYYNNINPLRPYVAGVDNTDNHLTTISSFRDDTQATDDVLAEFKWDNAKNGYNVVKMSVMVWMEGWDADYIVGVQNSAISVKLGFEIKEKQ